MPSAVARCGPVEHLAPAQRHRAVGAFQQRNRQRPPGALAEAAQQSQRAVEILEVRDELHGAAPRLPERRRERHQFVLRRFEARRRAAVARTVEERARSRQTHRAGLDRFPHELLHLLDVGCRSRFALCAAFAHDVHPQRRMREVAADIHVELACRQEVEILRIGFPRPRESFREHRMRDVFDALHEPHQHVVLIGPARCEADPAVAHHDGGYPVSGRGPQTAFPRDLSIVVRMDVDEAGRHDLPACVQRLGCASRDFADGGDAAVIDRDIRPDWRFAGAVHDDAPADQEIKIVPHEILPAFFARTNGTGQGYSRNSSGFRKSAPRQCYSVPRIREAEPPPCSTSS